MRDRLLVLALGSLTACASTGSGSVPLCAGLDSLPPLAAAGSCDDLELAEFSAALSEQIATPDRRALVRVAFDDAARVRSVCVERGVGTAAWGVRRHIAGRLDALQAHPPGPECLADRRLDLNRYDAKLAEIEDARNRCEQQVRITRETQPGTLRAPIAGEQREFERCMESRADWIVLDAPGSTRPRIFVKPEIPDPAGPSVTETASRCARTTHRFEAEAACIQADGFEMLSPPPR
jgi:hypothetical protein